MLGSGFFLLQLGINIISVFTRQLNSKEPFGLAELAEHSSNPLLVFVDMAICPQTLFFHLTDC